jgi:hypothetical protein
MEAIYLQILSYAVNVIAVIARLWRSEGWARFPGFDENGKFQINVIGIIVTGVLGSLTILDTVDFTTAVTLQSQLLLLWVIFSGVYGTPASLDFIGTLLGKKQNTGGESETITSDTSSNNEVLVDGEGEA